jgi:hypothetical protein
MNRFPLLVTAGLLMLMPAQASDQTFRLAKELLSEQRFELSAIEFRRFAMETEKTSAQTAAHLHAGYAYLRNGQTQTAGEMFDRAENADSAREYWNERTFLSAENARMAKDTDTALYFYDLLAEGQSNSNYQVFAQRRSAALQLGQGNLQAARLLLAGSPGDETHSLQALDAYAAKENKSPLIGGLLGLVPGAGYWYSGEIANGFRSLILNSLFIYGMAHTAEEEQWGAFSVITFFELTWYSGSIYGGIDAAQRHNQQRLNDALHEIEGSLHYEPQPEITIPVFKLNIHF